MGVVVRREKLCNCVYGGLDYSYGRWDKGREFTVGADGSSNLGAVSASYYAELEDDEGHGDNIVGIAGIEELPATCDGGPTLYSVEMVVIRCASIFAAPDCSAVLCYGEYDNL